MRAVKNIIDKDLEVSFNFFTYHFPKEKVFIVDDKLFAFLKEVYPLCFDFKIKVKKSEPVAQVGKTKTKAYIRTEEPQVYTNEDMKIEDVQPRANFVSPDVTPPSGTIDKDGVSWYGEGIEIEGQK